MSEHAVIVSITFEVPVSEPEMSHVADLSDQLADAIESADAGEFDGDDFGSHDCKLYMYGPDATKLYLAIEAVLKAHPICKGAVVVKRFGEASDPKAREERVVIG